MKWDMNRSISDLFQRAGMRGTREPCTTGRYWESINCMSGSPGISPMFCLNPAPAAAPGLTRASCTMLPRAGFQTIPTGVERVKIQYGTSLVYPVSSMGSHVSAIPNHQTQRNVPASGQRQPFCGTFGYELDLNLLTEEEQYQVKEQIRFMKEHRKLIQQGRFYRLISPFEGNEAAWIVVSEDGNKAIAAYFRFLQPVNTGFKRLVLKGLNPGTMYRVSGMDYTSYGD